MNYILFFVILLGFASTNMIFAEDLDPIQKKYSGRIKALDAKYESAMKIIKLAMIKDYEHLVKLEIMKNHLEKAVLYKKKVEALKYDLKNNQATAKEYKVSSKYGELKPYRTNIRLHKGDKIIIIPNVKDLWNTTREPDPHYPPSNYIGLNKNLGDGKYLMRLYIKIGEKQLVGITQPKMEITVTEDGALVLFCGDSDHRDNSGSIRVKIKVIKK